MAVPKDVEVEVSIAGENNAIEAGLEMIGEPSSFACPDCHGVLLRLKQSDPVRFRCHTNHAYSADSLIAAINEGIEHGWYAVRTLEEAHLLLEHLAKHAQARGDEERAAAFYGQVTNTREQAELVRKVAMDREGLVAAAMTHWTR